MTTQETTEKKVICKNAGVSPVFSHIFLMKPGGDM